MSNHNNNQDNPSFAIFGKSFQEGLVSLIFKDRIFCEQVREVLDIDFFEYKDLRYLVKSIFTYKDKYKEHPSISSLKASLNTEYTYESESFKQQVKELFDDINKKEIVEDKTFIKDRSLDFCKKQVLKQAMIQSIDLLEKSSFDEISTTINDALKLGNDSNVGHDYKKDFEDRYKIRNRNPVSTGWEEIDRITKGGFGKGELCVVLGGTGSGKSHLLVHFGAQAIKVGKTVVYYTLELSSFHVGNRFDSCITGISLDELHTCKDAIYETVKSIEGKLVIKEWPCKSVSINSIRNHLEKLKQRDINPDLIIVDYGDLLKSLSNYKERRHDLESIFEGLRSIAQHSECSLISATQSNRMGFNAELLSMESIAESFAKTFVADLVITLSRTREDKIANTARLYVAKNRNGADGIIYDAFFDPSRVAIKILDKQTSEEQPEIIEQKKKEKIKESYKKFIGK